MLQLQKLCKQCTKWNVNQCHSLHFLDDFLMVPEWLLQLLLVFASLWPFVQQGAFGMYTVNSPHTILKNTCICCSVLEQSFTWITVAETFCAFLSICNSDACFVARCLRTVHWKQFIKRNPHVCCTVPWKSGQEYSLQSTLVVWTGIHFSCSKHNALNYV